MNRDFLVLIASLTLSINSIFAQYQGGIDDGYDRAYEKFSLSEVTGDSFCNEFLVNTQTVGRQTSPQVAVANDGSFMVVWTDSAGYDGDGLGIFAQRYDSTGSRIGNEFRVNDITAGDQAHPSIGVDGTGNFVIVWLSVDPSRDDAAIRTKIYNDLGVPQGPEFQIADTQTTTIPVRGRGKFSDFGSFGLPAFLARAYGGGPAGHDFFRVTLENEGRRDGDS